MSSKNDPSAGRKFFFMGKSNASGKKLLPFLLLAGALLLASGCKDAEKKQDAISPEAHAATNDACGLGKAVETEGYHRLALIVGVGEYANPDIPDLKGPPLDARRFRDILTGANGYGFPPQNVCLLLNEEASTENFKRAFEKGLVERAGEEDVVVIFYAGHGSRTRDMSGDEPDGWDETFMFHDARRGKVRDLTDDEMNSLLSRLHKKTRHITIIIDSCNSGTATRGPEASTVRARFFIPGAWDKDDREKVETTGDGAAGWVPGSLPGLIAFSAASDGNPALENDEGGIFTSALVRVMSQVGESPLTYAQVARRVPPLVAASSPQVPFFGGDLSAPVFRNRGRERPVSWEVTKVGDLIDISGPPLPGFGRGAELRVYGGALAGADTRDPDKAKATMVVREISGLNARAALVASNPKAGAVAPGDLAVLIRPSDSHIRLRARLNPPSEKGGIGLERAGKLRSLMKSDREAAMLVEVTDGAGDFELGLGEDESLVLRGPENRIRNVIGNDEEAPKVLWLHARHRAILHLQGEGGADFTDNETLLVSLVSAPAATQSACVRGEWKQAPPGSEQIIPLCYAWNVRVALHDKAPMPLLVGALVLSSDGGIFALPRDNRKVLLRPGEAHTFADKEETFMGMPPLDVQDRVIAFGTQETNPVQWSLFTETAATRGAAPTGLQGALHRYLRPGLRGVGRMETGPAENTTWTLSTVTLRVLAGRDSSSREEAGKADSSNRLSPSGPEKICDPGHNCGR